MHGTDKGSRKKIGNAGPRSLEKGGAANPLEKHPFPRVKVPNLLVLGQKRNY